MEITAINPESMHPGTPVTFGGEVIKCHPIATGTSRYGEWRRRNMTLRQEDGSEVAVCAWNHDLLMNAPVGAHLTIAADGEGKGAVVEHSHNQNTNKTYYQVKVGTQATVRQVGQGSDPFDDGQGSPAQPQGQAPAQQGAQATRPAPAPTGQREDPIQRSIQLSVLVDAYAKMSAVDGGLGSVAAMATWVHAAHRAIYRSPSEPLESRVKEVFTSLLDWLGISDNGSKLEWKQGFENEADPSDVLERNLISATGKGNTNWVTTEDLYNRFLKDVSGLVSSREQAPPPSDDEKVPF